MDVIDTALDGETVVVSVSEEGMLINDANVIKEVRASNGIIYVIDKVLTPPEDEYSLIDWINDRGTRSTRRHRGGDSPRR